MKKLILLFSILTLFCSGRGYTAWSEQNRTSDNSSITLDTVTVRVREMIDDTYSPTGTVRYSSSTIYNLVNTAQRMLCKNTFALTSFATQQLTLNTTEYALPASCIGITRVTINKANAGIEEYIPQRSVKDLDTSSKQWNVDYSSQVPTSYYIRNRFIGIYPVPNNSGTILKIWYYKDPALMTAGSDFVFDKYVPLEVYYEALAAYAAHQIYLGEGNLAVLKTYSSIYAGAMQAIKQWIRFRPDYDPQITGADNY